MDINWKIICPINIESESESEKVFSRNSFHFNFRVNGQYQSPNKGFQMVFSSNKWLANTYLCLNHVGAFSLCISVRAREPKE